MMLVSLPQLHPRYVLSLHVSKLSSIVFRSGRSVPSCDTGIYPLRTSGTDEQWAVLCPLFPKLAKGHQPGGPKHALTLVPHFGGRRKGQRPEESAYSRDNPCLEKRMGKGPSWLGFYERPETLRRNHRKTCRGPRQRLQWIVALTHGFCGCFLK